jgi:hypothetical protein
VMVTGCLLGWRCLRPFLLYLATTFSKSVRGGGDEVLEAGLVYLVLHAG